MVFPCHEDGGEKAAKDVPESLWIKGVKEGEERREDWTRMEEERIWEQVLIRQT